MDQLRVGDRVRVRKDASCNSMCRGLECTLNIKGGPHSLSQTVDHDPKHPFIRNHGQGSGGFWQWHGPPEQLFELVSRPLTDEEQFCVP